MVVHGFVWLMLALVPVLIAWSVLLGQWIFVGTTALLACACLVALVQLRHNELHRALKVSAVSVAIFVSVAVLSGSTMSQGGTNSSTAARLGAAYAIYAAVLSRREA